MKKWMLENAIMIFILTTSLVGLHFLSLIIIMIAIPSINGIDRIVNKFTGYNSLPITDIVFLKEAYFFLIVLFFIIYCVKKQKFIIATVLSFIFPVFSPIVFIFLEISLYKKKKWLWFFYVMLAYLTIVISSYYLFRMLSQQ